MKRMGNHCFFHDFLKTARRDFQSAREGRFYGAFLFFQIAVFIAYLFFVLIIVNISSGGPLFSATGIIKTIPWIGGYFLFLLFLFFTTQLCRLKPFKKMTWVMVYVLFTAVLVFIAHILMGYAKREFIAIYLIVVPFAALSGIPFLFLFLHNEFLALSSLKKVMLGGIAALIVATVIVFLGTPISLMIADLQGGGAVDARFSPAMRLPFRRLYLHEGISLWSLPLSLLFSILFLFGNFFNRCKCKRNIYFLLFFLLCWSAFVVGYPVFSTMMWSFF